MKSPEQLRATIERRLRNTWHTDVAGTTASWPHRIAVGSATSAEMAAGFSELQQEVRELRSWANRCHLHITDTSRRISGTTQVVPTHITIDGLDAAAATCGPEWTERINRGRRRVNTITDADLETDSAAAVVRATDTLSDVDFDLLLTASQWFRTNDSDGLTPRQVPIPGLHAKWLDSHQSHVEALADRPLRLAGKHPSRLHFTYLDPDHLANGGRRFDVATVGDRTALAYTPRVVLITENKDTAVHFPATPGAVAVEGAGAGGGTAAAFDWLTGAEVLVYWGDIDTHGFTILDGFRSAGVPATSMLMDLDTYERHAEWGTYRWPNGDPIPAVSPRDLTKLTIDELDTYHAVCAPNGGLPPRIEQERIPLDVAHAVLLDIVSRRAVSLATDPEQTSHHAVRDAPSSPTASPP